MSTNVYLTMTNEDGEYKLRFIYDISISIKTYARTGSADYYRGSGSKQE